MRVLWLASMLTASAHPLAPAGLELVVDGDTVQATWVRPRQRQAVQRPQVLWPQDCTLVGSDDLDVRDDRLVEVATRRCPGAEGRTLTLGGLADSGIDVLTTVRVGQATTGPQLLDARQASVVLAAAPMGWAHIVGVGAEHLLSGLDHVLLVTSLVLLLGLRRPLIGALAAFTAGHALTLGLAWSGVVRLPAALVEVAIAATLVWAAWEVLRDEDAPGVGLLARWPVLVGAGVGLVHGLGFATALSEAGLAQGGLVRTLLGFHVGLELGQLGVVMGLALVAWCMPAAWRAHRAAPAWVIGVVAAAWVWSRALGG